MAKEGLTIPCKIVYIRGELEKPSEEQDKSIPDRRKIRKGPVVEKSTGEFHAAGG